MTDTTHTRDAARATLAQLAQGVSADRLLERIAARPDGSELRAALCEMGATALVAAVRVCQPTSARQTTNTKARTE